MAITKEVGYVDFFYNGIGKVVGLPNVFLHEILIWEDGKKAALVIGFDQNYVEALFFESENIDLTKPLFRTEKIFEISIGEKYLGRIINGFGDPIDGLGKIENKEFSPVFKEAPGIIEREPVNQALNTGIKVIDTIIPIGRGQRELIVGDKKTGKTTLALGAVLNQKKSNPKVYSVYVLVGQKKDKVDETIQILKENGAFNYTTIVVALADDPLVAQYLAPYVGCTIGEYFRDRGDDALVVYDDLTKHAKAYREISLLLERPPGREAYPGDIFYIHATLLERAAKLSKENKGGSLTALPIVETLENDITAFIPTNLISITDGQIYLDPELFAKGILPAINIGLSVSRVGSQAQPGSLRQATGSLKLLIAKYQALKKLIQLESTLSKESSEAILKGNLIMEALKQNKKELLSSGEETIIFYGLTRDYFVNVKTEEWQNFENNFLNYLRQEKKDILKLIASGKDFKEIEKKIQETIKEFNYI